MNQFKKYCTKFVQEIGKKNNISSPSISLTSLAYFTIEIIEEIFNALIPKSIRPQNIIKYFLAVSK
jgi:hypothetical protein